MKIKLHMDSYIADPYWPERSEVINIRKRSGCDRGNMGEAKREQALKAQVEKEGLSWDEYENLVARSQRRWYRDDEGLIIIPRHQLAGMLVETIGGSPKALRGNLGKDSFRALVKISDFSTGKKDRDEIYDRYIRNIKTTERRRQKDEVLKDFLAEGTITWDEVIKESDVLRVLSHGLRYVGLGGARKMGWGRGVIL